MGERASSNLAATKLRPPGPPARLVDRGRLGAVLDEADAADLPLVLVSAPAGSGKSTLVAGWAAGRSGSTAWLQLEESDADPARFWVSVVAAIGQTNPELAAHLEPLVAGSLGFLIYALAETGWVFLIGIPVMALWGIANPAAQALMTERVAVDEQGRLQGAVWSVAAIAGMIGPYLYTQVFAAFIAKDATIKLPGAPFLLAAILLCGAALLALRTTLARPRLAAGTP